MAQQLLMPKATAVWLVDNTALSFDQIAQFCKLHPLEVKAIADGRVVYVGWMHQLGLLLILDHGEGYFSIYGHAGAASRQVGEAVRTGQQIAVAGDTGGHRETGVYLEIRKGRTALNPQDWLAR